MNKLIEKCPLQFAVLSQLTIPLMYTKGRGVRPQNITNAKYNQLWFALMQNITTALKMKLVTQNKNTAPKYKQGVASLNSDLVKWWVH